MYVWIYKWLSCGTFYAIKVDDCTILEGSIDTSPSTFACNWIGILYKDCQRLHHLLNTRMKFLDVLKIETDDNCKWWCMLEKLTDQEFLENKHACCLAYLYVNSMEVEKYATFFELNKHFFGIEGVAAIKNEKEVLNQYFLQLLRYTDNQFQPFGLFELIDNDNNYTKIHPFKDIKFISSDFKHRPNISVVSYDIEMAVTKGDIVFPNGLTPYQQIVGISATQSMIHGSTGEMCSDSMKTFTWLLIPEPQTKELDANFVFTSEKDLLTHYLKFQQGFVLIIGFNTSHFDNNVLIARCLYHGIKVPIGPNKKFYLKSWFSKESFDIQTIGEDWQDHIDMLSYYQTFHTEPSLPNFRLETISHILLNMHKEDLNIILVHSKYQEMYRERRNDYEFLSLLVKYMVTDTVLPTRLFYLSGVYNLVSMISTLALQNIEVALEKISRIINSFLYLNMFSIGYTPYPQWKAMELKYAPKTTTTSQKKAKYQGGLVLDPIPGRYKNVYVFDYSSLYPSCIIAHNISPGFVFEVPKTQPYNEEHFHSVCDDDVFKLLTPKKLRTSLSRLEEMLIEKRTFFKAKKNESSYYAAVEQALKLMANAIYGGLGVTFQTLVSDNLAARAVTAYGRQHLSLSRSFFESIGMTTIYGDTDSNFVTNESIADMETGKQLVEQFYIYKNSRFPALEIEEVFSVMLLISKKCYVGKTYKGKFKIRGFFKILPPHMKTFITNVIDKILDTEDLDEFKPWITKEAENFMLKPRTILDVTQTRKIKNIYEYSTKTFHPMIVFARNLSSRGIDLCFMGGHVNYIIVLKDIENCKWQGMKYELVEDVKMYGLTPDIYALLSTYIPKLASLVKVSYNMKPKEFLAIYENFTKVCKEQRLTDLKEKWNISIAVWESTTKNLVSVDVNEMISNWNNHVHSYGLFDTKKESVKLAWAPNEGFKYVNYSVLPISQYTNLSKLKKLFGKEVRFKIYLSGNNFCFNSFFREIFNFSTQDMVDVDFHLTPVGVFCAKTFLVYDCIEKAVYSRNKNINSIDQ